MKKRGKKRIGILIILILVTILGIKLFKNSKANKSIELVATIVDENDFLENEEYIIQASSEDESGYCIILPNVINEKVVSQYYISEKNINENITKDSNKDIKIVEKLPNEKLYLTEEEVQNKKITLRAAFEVNENMLYKKVLKSENGNNKISVEGYMPLDSVLKVETLNQQDLNEKINKEFGNENTSLKVVYNIKIISDNKEYEPEELDESVSVTISGLDKIDETKQKYKIIHIKDDNTTEQIKGIESKEGSVTFETSQFSAYAVMVEDEVTGDNGQNNELVSQSPEIKKLVRLGAQDNEPEDVWDGSVAEGIFYGNGTQAKPYLISSGAELAYLANQVNNGTNYNGRYFQLAQNINLNGRAWNPIGNARNAFRGTFDGAGRKIKNGVITISGDLTTNTVESYGIFGSVGGGNNTSVIKNLQIENITINCTISGTTSTNTATKKGYNIGIAIGTLYNRAEVSNVSVIESSINAQQALNVRSRIFEFATGGIVGSIKNTYTDYADPRGSARYSISNCYANVDIDIANVKSQSTTRYYYMSLVHAGGIVGSIHQQPIWPQSCLYKGKINTNGFAGPIFGAVVNAEPNADNVNRFTAYWNGNALDANLTNTNYYTNYFVNGTQFTSTQNSGNSNSYIGSTVSNNSINGVKGVNKGQYKSNIEDLIDTFNNNSGDVTWTYNNGNLTLESRVFVKVSENSEKTFLTQIRDNYNVGNYTYEWYNNGTFDGNQTGSTYTYEDSFTENQSISLIVSDGQYYYETEAGFVERLYIEILYTINEATNTVTARLTGTAIDYVSIDDYDIQWYKQDMTGSEIDEIEGANTLVLRNMEKYYDYKIVATNTRIPELSSETEFTYGTRNVVYVKENGGLDTNDGLTEQTPVKTIKRAYQIIPSSGSILSNVIVVMGEYLTNDFVATNSSTSQNNYSKNAMITGKYKKKDYSASLYFYGSSDSGQGRCLFGNTGIQYLTLLGYNTSRGTGQTYLYTQGRDFYLGEQVYLDRYATTSNTNGMTTKRSPDFHIIGGFSDFNSTTLPRNNGTITIKSGAFARILAGTRNTKVNSTSHQFTGSSSESFNTKIIIDIKNPTRDTTKYDCDVNLIVAGQTDGNIYANTQIDIRNAEIARMIGGSIGYSREISGYPSNSYLGSSTLNVSGGSIDELYGGSLGRSRSDVYYYGKIKINISGGHIGSAIYGAGAGGVTGYSDKSSDPYKNYGRNYDTDVEINISGGTIDGNVYGAGYGYSSYLDQSTTARDGGTLYGDSTINITGGTINGDIYGAGKGYRYTGKESLAQMYGESHINISQNAEITGTIYGAGEGLNNYNEIGKLYGNSNINIGKDLDAEVYGGGNLAPIEGNTYININEGNHTKAIYGGGNLGVINGTSNVNVNNGISSEVYGGGNEAKVTTSIVTIDGGTAQELYAGGNAADVDETNLYLKSGNVGRGFGGSNSAGIVKKSNVETTGGTSTMLFGGNNEGGNTNDANVLINGGTHNAIYGGGNQVNTTKTTLDLKSADNIVPIIFGGGNQAGVNETIINCNGVNATKIFGGSNSRSATNQSIVDNSYIHVNSGTIENIYGGNNEDGRTINSNITVNGGTIENVYGGGEEAVTTKSLVRTYGGTIENVYGGGNQANVDTTEVRPIGGTITNVFGGSNKSGDVNQSNIITNEDITQNPDPNPGTNPDPGPGPNPPGPVTPSSQTGLTMNVEYTASDTYIWESFTYPTKATITVTFTNNSDTDISEYSAHIIIPNSTLNTNYSQTDISYENDTYTMNEQNRYYGVNVVPAGGSYSVEFTVFTRQNKNNFTLDYELDSPVYQENPNPDPPVNPNPPENPEQPENPNPQNPENEYTLLVDNIYGGNNQGGMTVTSNVKILGSGIKNVYGGGNQAITNNTYVDVQGNVDENVYGGGNGTAAVVRANTNLTIQGNSVIGKSVFGGGNKAATGTESQNNSESHVNIVGGKIGKNVYGGANTSVIYGKTITKIGYNAVENTNLQKSDIEIDGTIFGGGEANEAGSEIFDFDFISVTDKIDIRIDGSEHNNFNIYGSIFGSGNASSTSGQSEIYIVNYGTPESPKRNVSLQRTDCATIDNSAISLSGATDRTNEYSATFFAISRASTVKLKNNSVLYLQNGANLLKDLESLVDVNGEEQEAQVSIDETTGDVTKNVDNRIYMLEGKNLNVATNESATTYGKVHGMFFLGIFANRNNPSTSAGLYATNYENGDEITNAGTFVSNSYVKAQHVRTPEHDITKDGFYTNYNDEGTIKCNYIDTIPKEDLFYIWYVGEDLDVTSFELDLVASKYATLGTTELQLQGFSVPNQKFTLIGFSSGLLDGVSLVNPSNIPAIEEDEDKANNVFGLSMKTGNIGWQNRATSTFTTDNGGTYEGNHDYQGDNSAYTPTLNFCFYHSENLTEKRALGDVKIRFQVITPLDDLNDKISYIDINITMSTALYQDDYYEAAITPGQEFGLFTSTATTITSKSALSTYFSLYVPEFAESDYYEDYNTYSRVLVSRDRNSRPYVFPKNTKITMLDMVTNEYYYYVVDEDDVTNNKFEFMLKDFIRMGTNDSTFDEVSACNQYYNEGQNLIYENFIFHINFDGSDLNNNIEGNTLLMELRDMENQTLVGVLGIQRAQMNYNVYLNNDATISLSATENPETLYLGNKLNLDVSTNFTQSIVDSKTIYDTQYFDKKLGIKITFYDKDGNRLSSDSLFGVKFELDNHYYYPRFDGTTRINIANKVTDVLARIKMHTEENTTLATGDYTIKIESFGSSDGIYYGLEASDEIDLPIRIINSAYGLKVVTDDQYKIIDKDKGTTKNGNNTFISNIQYSSKLANPKIVVALYRRDYSEIYSQEYNLVNLADYVKDYLAPTTKTNEYIVTESPSDNIRKSYTLKGNLKTGTYKLVYKLYDDDTLVGEDYEYIVIK